MKLSAGHGRVRKWKPLTGKCEGCGSVPPTHIRAGIVVSGTELHNVSGEYRWEDKSDWIEVCRKCHWRLNRGLPIDYERRS